MEAPIKRLVIPLLLLVCFLVISAAAANLHDIQMRRDEAIVIDHKLRMPAGRAIPIVRSRDQAERDARWDALTDRIEAMDELEKSEFIGYMIGLFDGMLMRQEPAT